MYTYTQPGRAHLRAQMPNEDALLHRENAAYAVYALADGVGSCPQARSGAALACQAAASLLLENAALFLTFGPQKVAAFLAAQVQHALRQSGNPGDQAAVLLCCLQRKADGQLLLCSLGDALPLTVKGGACHLSLPAPDSRQGVRTTADQDAADHLEVRTLSGTDYDALLMMSDGAWQAIMYRGRIRPEAAALLVSRQYEGLAQFLAGRDIQDDHSFIAIENPCTKGGPAPWNGCPSKVPSRSWTMNPARRGASPTAR